MSIRHPVLMTWNMLKIHVPYLKKKKNKIGKLRKDLLRHNNQCKCSQNQIMVANNIVMMDINESSRKIVFAIQRRQKSGSGGNQNEAWVQYESFTVCFWEVSCGGLWQNHGTSPGGGKVIEPPLLFPLISPDSCCGHLLISPLQSLLISPRRPMEQSRCGFRGDTNLLWGHLSGWGYVA